MFFQLFLGVLTRSDVFSDLESFVVPCACARGPTASVWLLSLKSSPVCGSHPWEVSSALLTLLTCFQVYLNCSQRSACVRACLACSFLHGKFSITDGFAGLPELPTSPWTCMRTLSMPGQLGSIVPVHPTAARRPNYIIVQPENTAYTGDHITAKYSGRGADVVVADGQFMVTPTTKPFEF